MVSVAVRSLAGRRAEVEAGADQTLRNLKLLLGEVDGAFASCKLFLRASGLGLGSCTAARRASAARCC